LARAVRGGGREGERISRIVGKRGVCATTKVNNENARGKRKRKGKEEEGRKKLFLSLTLAILLWERRGEKKSRACRRNRGKEKREEGGGEKQKKGRNGVQAEIADAVSAFYPCNPRLSFWRESGERGREGGKAF